jgi:C-terminal duplication domain of Friend of PRMT1
MASGHHPQVPIQPRKVTAKKGPKRLKKRPVTAADLDREMDAYRAGGIPADDATMS